jgi:hypothetical protein
MKYILFALSLTCVAPTFAADPEETIGARDCKVINPHPVFWERISWTGPCKDGYADGPGTLEWFVAGTLSSHFEGTLKRGRRHGNGYRRDADGHQYEGAYVDGKLNGLAVEQTLDLTRYEGQWKDGRKEGKGKIIYATGGSYEGEWKADTFHGAGKATYTSGKVIEGQFVNGVPAGQPGMAAPGAGTAQHLRSTNSTAAPFKEVIARANGVPFRKSWDALSQDEQRRVRMQYALLAEEDEPPYPAKGTEGLIRSISAGQKVILTEGLLRMIVMVDSTGIASEVKVFASPDPAMSKVATFVVMTEKYKPALCAGTPCAMVYPFSFQFSVD